MIWIGYSAMWLSLAAAACFGMYETHSPLCILVMAVGLFVSLESESKRPG